jgi:hypothetical protein
MRRPYRIAVEILAPPLVAWLLGVAILEHGWPTGRFTAADLRALAGLLGFAYVAAGLPSLVFALLMELAFARWFEPRSGLTLVLATGLGGLAGVAVSLILREAGVLQFLVILGLAAGAVVGLILFAAARLGGSGRRAPQLRLELPR